MKAKQIAALALLIIFGCAWAIVTPPQVKNVNARTFQKDISKKGSVTVDVRTPAEFAEGHIEDAININVAAPDFVELAEKELPKDKTIYVYCRSGRRSLTAAESLIKLGYKVVNLKGGITEWTEAGLPIITEANGQN